MAADIIQFSQAITAAEYAAAKRKAERTRWEDALCAQYKQARLPTFVREYHYAIKLNRKFRADIAFVPDRLIIQVEGGIYSGGKHTRGKGFESDCERDAIALVLGWQVLRVTPKHIKTGLALRWTEQILIPPQPENVG